ncbi:MAG: peptidase T, partial [Oscillospiraceae bacterium]|nr:peptidase T [Oscillospiraceae bacterium]
MNIKERFLKYVSFDTTSDENSETVPTTAKQKRLGQFLADELKAMGLEDAHMDEFGYVYGYLPASPDRVSDDALGLIAHMDTAPAVSGTDIKPSVIAYAGGDIELGNGVSITEKNFPYLKKYVGQDLIVTDGTTLLGADDKAGVAEIFTACEYLIAHP